MQTPSKWLPACLVILFGLFVLAMGFLQGYSRSQVRTLMALSGGTGQRSVPTIKTFSLGKDSQATRLLLPSEFHRYAFLLKPGDFLEVAVEQDPVREQEIDLSCKVLAPDGTPGYSIDNPSDARGSEYVRLVADAPGAYQIEIKGGPKSGIYKIRQVYLRPAESRDRVIARAEYLFYKGRSLGLQKQYKQALDAYRKAQELWHGIGDWAGEASALDRSARLLVKRQLGDWDKVESLRSQALHLWRYSHNLEEEVNSLVGLGEAQGKQGKFELADANLQEALRLSSTMGDQKFKADALNTLALITADRGDLVRAHELYQQALLLWERMNRTEEQFKALTALGQINLSLGNVALAQQSYLRADALDLDDALRAQSLSRLCELYTRQGNLDWALVYGKQAVALREKIGDLRGEAVSLTGLAGVYQKKNNISRARAVQEDALVLSRRSKDRHDEAIARYNLGLILLEENNYLLAISQFEASFNIARELRYSEGQELALYGLAFAQYKRGNPLLARRWIEQAFPLIEAAPQSTGNDESSAGILASLGSYEFLIKLLVTEPADHTSGEDIASSFVASERSRWRSLREWLFAVQDNSLRKANRDDQLEQMKDAVPESEASEHLDEDAKSSSAQIESIRLREAEIHRRTIWNARATSPRITLRQVQELLDSETILLEYFLGGSRSYLWLVTPNTAEVFALPGREIIEEKCRSLYALFADSRSQSHERQASLASQELSKILLGPLAKKLTDKRLIIVRDGAINSVPFAAFADPMPIGSSWLGSGPPPLILHHEIVYLPSASVLLAMRKSVQNRVPPSGLMAVVADPVFAGGMYESLPRSRVEGQLLTQLALKRGKVMSAYGYEANRDLVMKGKLSDFRYLVFATHGINDPIHPELSAIVLSQRGPTGELLKGHLRVQDIKSLDLKADLVFLSGCDTSLGSKLVGEGFMGLVQGFMYAGVPRVIANLWSVREEATPTFSEHVFRSILIDGSSPAKALREAQIWMAEKSEWRSPFYWAGFEIHGDWR